MLPCKKTAQVVLNLVWSTGKYVSQLISLNLSTMTFFGIFRRNTQQKSVQTSPIGTIEQPVLPVSDNDIIPREDSNAASQSPQTASKISQYLERDFASVGYYEGYRMPNAEFLENQLKLIRSNFRLLIDKDIDSMRSSIWKLKIHLIEVTGISERKENQLKEKVIHYETLLHELDLQKVLSIEDEGMIAPAISSYKSGFLRGLDRYQNEKFLANETGLFN